MAWGPRATRCEHLPVPLSLAAQALLPPASPLPPTPPPDAAKLPGVHLRPSLDAAMEMLSGPDFEGRLETVFVIGGGQVGGQSSTFLVGCAAALGRPARPGCCLALLPACAAAGLRCSRGALRPVPTRAAPTRLPPPGPQVYVEAMESPALAAIHLTQVESDAECDTHMPPIDEARFRLWSAAAPRRDGSTRYAFLCYTRAGQEPPPALPPATAARHEELQAGRRAGLAGQGGAGRRAGGPAGLRLQRQRPPRQLCAAHRANWIPLLPRRPVPAPVVP